MEVIYSLRKGKRREFSKFFVLLVIMVLLQQVLVMMQTYCSFSVERRVGVGCVGKVVLVLLLSIES